MKTKLSIVSGRPNDSSAFTLPEMLITVTLFALLILGLVCANLFGLRWSLIAQTKMKASDEARETVGKMSDEIRNSGNVSVGTMSNSVVGTVTNLVFVAHINGEAQTGNGLMINAATNASSYVLYFVNPLDQTLRRTTSATGSTTITVAQTVTNSMNFVLENYRGTVLSNIQDNCVVHCRLQFYSAQPQSPVADSYSLDFSVAPRSLN